MIDHRIPSYAVFVVSLALLGVTLGACSDDSTEDTGTVCESDELYDQYNDTCVPRGLSTDSDAGADGEDPGDDDDVDNDPDISETPDATADAQTDASDDDAIDPAVCDKDNDNSLAESCGGFDCDDNDPSRSPFAPELCDHVDNNCSGTNNDNIECNFYAHSPEKLYKIDPFSLTATEVHSVPGLQDIDTHPDGTLFGIKHDGVYRYDSWSDTWRHQGGFGLDIGDSNGLAIDRDGTAFITSDDKIYSADLRSGNASFVGLTGNFKSSGDCVVDKGNTLYMTSKVRDQNDTLVKVSRETGEGTPVGTSGAVGFEKVYSLTSAWGTLYGLTSNGELIEINRETGAGTLLHTFPDKSFWGAASTPNR